MLAALVQGHLDEVVLAGLLHDAEVVRARVAVLELDAVLQALAEVARDRADDVREVGLLHAVLRVREAVRQLAVVGEQDDALGLRVEPAHVEEPGLAVGDVVAEALPALGVLHRRDDTGGLVQREELVRLRGDGQAVDLDLVLLRVDAAALLEHDLAVDLDPGLFDQLLAGAPGAVARAGQDLLQPLALLLGAREGLRELHVLLARVALAVALLDPRLVLAGARRGGTAPAALLGGRLRAAAPGLRTVLGGSGADVVAALLGAGLAGAALPLLLVPVIAGATVVTASAALSAAAASHQSSVVVVSGVFVVGPSSGSGASGSNDGTPSWVSASIASASGRKGASSGSSSRPRRPIRSRK